MLPLFVAKPLLPDLANLTQLLQGIWDRGVVTNQGPLHNLLEEKLAQVLDVPFAVLCNNGTAALQCALLAFRFPAGSEIITTPLTFAATAHVISAAGMKPVFADVDEDSLTLDLVAVERAITDKTVAVIAVHVYGTICNNDGLDLLCKANGLKLLYDSAHAFASSVDGRSVALMGDLSVFSLHATKLFNTFEGGLITTQDSELGQRLRRARNFGIMNEERVTMVGINGKMNELNAAIGLLNLEIFEHERRIRTALRVTYDRMVDNFPGLRKQIAQPGVKQSEQYYMFRVDSDVFGCARDVIYERLKERQIMTRRYFWPICTDFDCYLGEPIVSQHIVPVVERIKDRVLCLPFHSGVEPYHVTIIEEVLNELVRH
jgi:dTDP-4-amino-4,6-dideoxygalactose transaminase